MKANAIVFFIFALVNLNAHGRSGSCSIDPAIGDIAGKCEKLENKEFKPRTPRGQTNYRARNNNA